MTDVYRMMRFARYAWAAPATAVGLIGTLAALPIGATARVVDGVLEVGGGRLAECIDRLPAALRFQAITLGHVILGTTHAALCELRTHERVHVRQYERWGLLFFPLYLGSSLVQWLRGRHPYLDNRFEREAFVGCASAVRGAEESSRTHAASRIRIPALRE